MCQLMMANMKIYFILYFFHRWVWRSKIKFHTTVSLRPSSFIIYFLFSTCYIAYFYMEYMANKGLVGATVSEISILGKLWVYSIK